MLVRRSRALVKPNIAKVSKLGRTLSEKVTPASKGDKGDTECADIAPAVAVECSDHTQGIEPCTSEAVAVTVEDIPPAVNHEQPATCESDPVYEDHVDPLAPERRIAHVPVDYSKLLSPKSSDRCYSDYYEPTLPRPRKKFTGDEELDPKKMRMMDMIYWNPKKEKGMSRRHVETESVISQEKQPVTENVDSKTSKLAAPQVVIGPDGRLVLDEKSLVVTETVNDESVWETIDEDRVSRKVTSLSFRNRMWRKGTSWTEKETELFYEILRCTGPDFGLMHEFFPTRARNELKTKFNREERNNWAKLKEVMGRPALLDDDLYERAAALQKEIAEEAFNKKMKKVKDVEKKVKETASKEKKVLTPEEEAA
ncbi:SANT domain-containing protein, partial [Trichostrongylus colubriformis]